jgi:hypothetical protein
LKERTRPSRGRTGAGADQVIFAEQKPGGGGLHRNKIICCRHEYFLNRIGNFFLATYKVLR